jgi:3-phenylpropionate/trans-cinnamate dioxygenase ferredoxin reductase subunit
VRVVVVGASLAGIRTVEALRRAGCDARVTVVDAAGAIACDRPPLSKEFLADPAVAARPLLTAGQLAGLDVDLVLGHRATALDTGGRRIELDDSRRLPYDTLVVATGSAPRTLPGLEPLAGVHVLRTDEHATAIRAALVGGARTVVVGGGFIGAEVAWAARALGCDVSIVEPLPTLMTRGLGPALGEAFARRHAAAGVRLRLGVGVSAIVGAGRVEMVRLSDGSTLPADLVVIGVGTAPQTDWLAGSGLEIDDGVRCDARLAALGADGVYAAGDVARWDHPGYREPVRVEHWTNAVEHARIVAANICGHATVYGALPYVWSDQLGGRLQIVGRVRPTDEVRYVFGGPDEPRFVAVTGGPDGLGAVVGFDAVRELMRFRKLLLDGVSWRTVLEAASAPA